MENADQVPNAAEAEETHDNRRVHPRVFRPPVEISGIWGEVVDISLTGLAVTATGPLEAGTTLDLVLTDSRSHEQRWIPAEVMWSTPSKAGLRWVDLSDEDRQWLIQRFSNWLRLYRETLRVMDLQFEEVPDAPASSE